jgi:hypothetical protein
MGRQLAKRIGRVKPKEKTRTRTTPVQKKRAGEQSALVMFYPYLLYGRYLSHLSSCVYGVFTPLACC